MENKKGRNKRGQFIKGHHSTKEIRKKISIANKGKQPTREARKKMSEAGKGRIHTKKAREKMRQARFKNPIKYWLGKKRPPLSEEIKEKLRKANKGVKSSFWKGGISGQKGYKSFMEGRRRIRKLNNGGSHTLGEWENLKAQYNWTCPCCKKSEPKIKLTEDHIIPLSKGGSDNIENIQPLCSSCNSRKNIKMIKYNM